ncbi:MAG: 50S ribosomal protein L31e [Nanoarchaeota archaeon]|nr:50S ribosomal protein L31e [Nanoarchaeota archaeon]MBU0963138.1 50S ribosomal protein L31e [Nanoarchaeota archaeon]
MAEDNKERIHVIPLRRAFLKAPNYKRTKRAVNEIRNFICRHMKVEDVRIGSKLNDYLWINGNKNPPSKVKIKTRKIEDYAQVELVDHPFFEKKEKEEKNKKVEAKETKQDKVKGEGIRAEEKLVNEGKAKEIEEKESKKGPEPQKKEELKTKIMAEKIERTKRISKTQKTLIKHPKQSKVGH